MMNKLYRGLAPAVTLSMPLLAHAQAGKAGPSDARSPAPTLRHQSSFADDKPWQGAKPGDWRALNDMLRSEIAGGAGHGVRTMPGVPAAASAPSTGAPRPCAAAHGHRGHGGKP